MKNRNPNGNGNGGGGTIDGPKSMSMKKKRNMNRLGGSGSGLSLTAFANAKSTNNQYNPGLIKKKRVFYQNAKYVNKYKKSLKQQNEGNNGLPSATRTPEDGNEETSGSRTNKMSYNGLKEVYEKQLEEKEKARIERDAEIHTNYIIRPNLFQGFPTYLRFKDSLAETFLRFKDSLAETFLLVEVVNAES